MNLKFRCIQRTYCSTRTETLAEAQNITWPLQLASLAQRVWCAVKTQKKTFRGQGASTCYLERHELLCLYNSLVVANHTEGV